MSETMSGYEAYQSFLAVTKHFKGTYDYFKYGGKINTNYDSFLIKKDKYLFDKVAKKYKNSDELLKFLVSSTVDGNRQGWIGDLLNPYHDIVYKKWKKKIESLSYNFKEDLSHLNEIESDFNNMFKFVDGKHPLLFRAYSGRKISLETLVILDELVHYTKAWQKEDDLILKETIHLIEKYSPFVWHFSGADKKKLKQIVLETYS
jgi:hypothetical protein